MRSLITSSTPLSRSSLIVASSLIVQTCTARRARCAASTNRLLTIRIGPWSARYLDAVGAQARHHAGRRGEARDRNRVRPYRRARPSAPAGADLAQPAVRERSNADPLPSTEAIEQRRERRNTRIGLGVDVDPDGRPSCQLRDEATISASH
jgi:hypothetical protein